MKLSKIFNRQLALPLNFRKLKNQDNFLINDSNKMAVSLIDEMKNLSVFKKKYIFPILYLYGPERSGKTHLASIFKENNNAKFINRIEEKDLLNAKNGCSYIIDNLEKNSNLDPKMLMHLINEVYSGSGSILLIGSMAALMGLPDVSAYSIAKSAMHGMVYSLTAEYAPQGVRVNAILPGWIESKMALDAFEADPKRREKVFGRTPMDRLGRAEEVGHAAVFLASPAASFVTGALLTVDGGASTGF